MPTPNVLRALCAVLAQLYPDKASASRIAKDAGIPITLVTLNDRAIDNWHAILQEAAKQDRLALLLAVVNEEYAANPRLRAVMLQLQGWPALFATLAVMGQQLTPHRVGLGATLVVVLVIIGVWGNRQLTVANEQPTPSPTAIITVAAPTPTPQPTPASFTYSVTVRDPEALGDKQQALDYYTQALPLFRTVGDKAGEAVTLTNIGAVYYSQGKVEDALRYMEDVLAIQLQIGAAWEAVISYAWLGVIHQKLGDLDSAAESLETALALATELNHPDLPDLQALLAEINAQRGE